LVPVNLVFEGKGYRKTDSISSRCGSRIAPIKSAAMMAGGQRQPIVPLPEANLGDAPD
jgi:hypothetical protein